jgi:hypothetical protein
MTITLGAFSFNTLTAQPYGFAELDAYQGLSAPCWRVSGLCTQAEWASITSVYTTWRDARITDQDTMVSRVVGTTVNFSGNAAGLTWTTVPCWFLAAPSGEQTGNYISVSFEVVDAAKYLQALLAQQEKGAQGNDALKPDLGQITISYGGYTAVLTLNKPPETYSNAPTVELTAAGVPYLSGPLTALRVRDIDGTCDATNWTSLQSWFETIVKASPPKGTWYPTSAPNASATAEIKAGVKTTVYNVSLQLTQL